MLACRRPREPAQQDVTRQKAEDSNSCAPRCLHPALWDIEVA
jgi:hypothetical protein